MCSVDGIDERGWDDAISQSLEIGNKNDEDRTENISSFVLISKGGIDVLGDGAKATRSDDGTPRAPLKILLAEDNPGDVQLFSVLLEMSDLSVILKHVTDGEKALEYLRSIDDLDLPDVILLDLRMPRMDGFDFLKERKRDARLSSVLTVVLTSSNAPRDRRMAMELGADLFLLKPDRMDEAEELIPILKRFILKRTEPQASDG